MAETRTAEEAINKAAAILGKYVPGEALGDVEHQTISDALDDTLKETAKIVAIGDRDQIPGVLFETIARLTAIHAASEFSNQPLDLNAIFNHEQRLRYLVAQTPTYETLGVYYF
jgi:hypothetical protein